MSALKIKPIKTASLETSQMFKIQLLGKNSKYNIKNKNNSLERIKYKRKMLVPRFQTKNNTINK